MMSTDLHEKQQLNAANVEFRLLFAAVQLQSIDDDGKAQLQDEKQV